MVTSVNSIFTLQGHGVHLGILVRVEGWGKKKCAYPYSSWILDITGFKIFNWSTTDIAGWFLVSNREYCNFQNAYVSLVISCSTTSEMAVTAGCFPSLFCGDGQPPVQSHP